MVRVPLVYILASRKNGAIYTGVTSKPVKRVWEHKNDFIPCFTSAYRIHKLVWYEVHATMDGAIKREKAIKRWRRDWKNILIEKINPEWKDLFDELIW